MYVLNLGKLRRMQYSFYIFSRPYNLCIVLCISIDPVLAMLCVCCFVQTLSSWSEWGLLLVVVSGFLIAVASPVVEHGLEAKGLQ